MKSKQDKILDQTNIRKDIIKRNINCEFGNSHFFSSIKNYGDFLKNISISHYEDYHDLIIKSMQCNKYILSSEKILYFAQTAGTTSSGDKYIPVTKSCIKKNHQSGGKELIKGYLYTHPKSKLLEGKALILGGGFSQNGSKKNVGYISAILQRESSIILDLFREPRLKISFMTNREEKIDKIIESTIKKNITSLSGLTSRSLILLHKILSMSDTHNITKVRPNLELYISGGINFEPYRKQFQTLLPHTNFCQSYNASEGFFGIQYQENNNDLELLTNHGVFFEFIELKDYYDKNYTSHTIETISKNRNYVVIITTYGGLYRYVIGDVISFSSTEKLTFKIVGRTKLYIDVFGEHLMIHDADQAIKYASERTNSLIYDYTVAPLFNGSKGCHERIIAFEKKPKDIKLFTKILDKKLQEKNSYYKGKRDNNSMLTLPIVHCGEKDIFYNRLNSKKRIGGQYKIPRLSNNREIIEEILKMNF